MAVPCPPCQAERRWQRRTTNVSKRLAEALRENLKRRKAQARGEETKPGAAKDE